MSYIDEWKELTDNQTDETFKDFWDEYAGAEKRIYSDILTDGAGKESLALSGIFKELVEKYETTPAIFMGFLEGIETSLTKPIPNPDTVADDTLIELSIDPTKLYFNMHAANAEHLYSIEAWDGVLDSEKRADIEKDYRRSRIVRKEKTPGRNDPCPCGSGKKYKKCCGA